MIELANNTLGTIHLKSLTISHRTMLNICQKEFSFSSVPENRAEQQNNTRKIIVGLSKVREKIIPRQMLGSA